MHKNKTNQQPIDLAALSVHERALVWWASISVASLLFLCILLVISYFAFSQEPAVVSKSLTYKRDTAIFGSIEVVCMILAILTLIRFKYVRSGWRERIFRRFLTENNWAQVRTYDIDRVAAILLGPSTTLYEEDYSFKGTYKGHAFTCLIFQFIAEDSRTRRFICLNFKLPKSYPMIIVDNKLNDNGYRRGNSNLPDRIPQGISFDLEGNFSEYYKVSTTKGSENDAVQVLSPEVMADLVDAADKKVDIEISDKDLFLIYEDDFYTKQNVMALFAVADVMLQRLGKLSKTWLALGKWEERIISRTARMARDKLMSGLDMVGMIVFAVGFVVMIFLMVSLLS